MIQPHIIKNFISNDTIKVLNEWALNKVYSKPKIFYDACMGSGGLDRTRLSTRVFFQINHTNFNLNNIINYPDEALELRVKIAQYFNLKNYKDPPYCNGIICGIGYNNGDIKEHTDPVYYDDTYTLHCNAITQAADEGGITIIEGIPYPTKPNDILIYPVSKVKHKVTTIKGNTARILWVFGYCINDER